MKETVTRHFQFEMTPLLTKTSISTLSTLTCHKDALLSAGHIAPHFQDVVANAGAIFSMPYMTA